MSSICRDLRLVSVLFMGAVTVDGRHYGWGALHVGF
jgi:hypothetical protein